VARWRRVVSLRSRSVVPARAVASGLGVRVAAEASSSARRAMQGGAAMSLPTGALGSMCEPPNPRMQPTGRMVPSSGRALLADGDQRNVSWRGRELDRPQLICRSLACCLRIAREWRVA
jgi:hypothetical protein